MTFFRNVLLVLLALTSSFSCHASPNSTQDNQQLKATRLVTDAEHKMFLIHTLQSAQRSVMISSHDISPKIFQEDNIGQFIINTANRGVAVYIYVDHEAGFYGREYNLLQKLKQVCKYAINSNH